jgi:hypothetical protein
MHAEKEREDEDKSLRGRKDKRKEHERVGETTKRGAARKITTKKKPHLVFVCAYVSTYSPLFPT